MAHCFDTVEPRLIDVAHGERESEGVPRKPDPAGLLLIMKELEVEPERCIYFGDSAGDIICAHAAGVYAVGAPGAISQKKPLYKQKPMRSLTHRLRLWALPNNALCKFLT